MACFRLLLLATRYGAVLPAKVNENRREFLFTFAGSPAEHAALRHCSAVLPATVCVQHDVSLDMHPNTRTCVCVCVCVCMCVCVCVSPDVHLKRHLYDTGAVDTDSYLWNRRFAT